MKALGEYFIDEWSNMEIQREWSLIGKWTTCELKNNIKLSTKMTSKSVEAWVIGFIRVGL